MLRLLIFDLDGTLLDTIIDITNAINYAVEPFGIKPLPVDVIKSMVGSGITNLIGNLLPDGTSTSKRDKSVNRFIEYYSKHLLDNTKPYPGVKKTLPKLANYKKAVISNKRESLSKNALHGLGLLGYFALVLGSDSVPERKPSPFPVLEVLKRLCISRDEAVIIGDSNYDIEAGKAAGIRTIAVTYGYRQREMLENADIIIDTFEEILNILPKVAETFSITHLGDCNDR